MQCHLVKIFTVLCPKSNIPINTHGLKYGIQQEVPLTIS